MATDVITTPGTDTWTCPAGVTSVVVRCWGPGGNGANSVFGGGGGGGGGGFASKTIAVTPAAEYDYQLGAGGSTDGTWFDTSGTVFADYGVAGSGTAGGDPGDANIGDAANDGGTGGDAADGAGGGGGSSAGTSGDGNDGGNGAGGVGGTGGAAPTGGGGGGAGGDFEVAGVAGSTPGGGGGGGGEFEVGGAGANGRIEIEYTAAVPNDHGSFRRQTRWFKQGR